MKFLNLLFTACLMVWSLTSIAQEKTVSGTVLASNGDPLAGAAVTNTTTNKGTQTNQTGHFSIAAEKGHRLVITHVGYAQKEIIVENDQTINIKLKVDDKNLDAVVVTAYGQKRNKRELSYQVPVVKGEEIAQTRRDNFLNALNGRVPGLTVTSSSGAPGASSQIILRGAVSIAGNSQPLFVIDGVPANNSTFNQNDLVSGSVTYANRNADYTNRIADINPEDIETVTILKGPEATAQYGSDGASGAILITTKKGVAGKTNISYSNSFRIEQVGGFPKVQTKYSRGENGVFDPSAYSELRGFFMMFGDKYPIGTPVYDNGNNFFQNRFSQQHNISIDAGKENLTYRFSAGYLKTDGVVPSTNYEKINLGLSASAKINPQINMTSSWAYTISTNNKSSKGPGGYYVNLVTWPVDVDIRSYLNSDGSRKLLRKGNQLTYASEIDNPFWDINKNTQVDKTDHLLGTISLNYNAAKWLNIVSTIGIEHFTTDGNQFMHPQSRFGYSGTGFVSNYTQNFKNVNGTFKMVLKKTIADKYSNNITLGFFVENGKTTTNSTKGEKFYDHNFNSINNTDPTTRGVKLSIQNIRKARAFGNYTFGYNNLLFLTIGGSYEGISTLTSAAFDKQPFFGYGSAAGSFIFSDLEPVKKLAWLSYGKLRASYATSGKAPYAAYVIDNRFTPQSTTGGGFALDVIAGNSDLRPEFSKNFEVGGELQFFKNRLGIDIAFYSIRSRDQIITNRLSYGTGAVIKWINGGLISNKGIEIQLTGTPIKTKNFAWDVVLNFDRNKGIVESMPADLPFYYESDTWAFGNVRSQVGKGLSISNLAGINLKKNKAGQVLIDPTTGLPIKETDFTSIGDRNPDYKMGIINNFTFTQNWSLSFNIDIRKGGDIFNGNAMMMILSGVSPQTLDRETPRIIEGVLKDGLEETSQPTKNNIAVTPYYRSGFYSSTHSELDFMETVNWVRLRDITLTFRLPSSVIKKQKIFKSASFSVTGTDLLLISNYSGIDPTVSVTNASTKGIGGTGIDYGAIPTTKGMNFSIKAQF